MYYITQIETVIIFRVNSVGIARNSIVWPGGSLSDIIKYPCNAFYFDFFICRELREHFRALRMLQLANWKRPGHIVARTYLVIGNVVMVDLFGWYCYYETVCGWRGSCYVRVQFIYYLCYMRIYSNTFLFCRIMKWLFTLLLRLPLRKFVYFYPTLTIKLLDKTNAVFKSFLI